MYHMKFLQTYASQIAIIYCWNIMWWANYICVNIIYEKLLLKLVKNGQTLKKVRDSLQCEEHFASAVEFASWMIFKLKSSEKLNIK